jgi:hypothetical protein
LASAVTTTAIRRLGPLLLLLLAAAPSDPAPAQEFAAVAGQMTTDERLRRHPWWPRKTFATAGDHVGSAACGECHASILADQETTAMARTLAPAAGFSGAGAGGDFELGPYRYVLAREPAGLGFTVSDGAHSRSARIEWVFGAGATGFSYLWRQDGVFYESRFSFFPTLEALAATPGRLRGVPVSLEMAVGRPLPVKEAEGCFSCHASALVDDGGFDPRRLTPGITCEGCHGPGADHVALFKSGLDGTGAVFAPGRLDAGGVLDFCGACHGTFWDVELGPAEGVGTVRSPSFRLAKSRCWGGGGGRLTCLSCHDPHRRLEPDPQAYDAVCLSCHAGAKASAAAASSHRSVVRGSCVSCHMPKVELPEVHVQSTDHWIRVVREGEAPAG